MTGTSQGFPVNQKAAYIHHTLQDYSLKDPWLHLHQIGQMSDDKVDPLQMQLQKHMQFNYSLKLGSHTSIRQQKICDHHQTSSH